MKLKRLENNKAPELALNKLQAEMKKQIELKIENGKYQFEEIECHICKHKNSEVIGEKDRYGLFYQIKLMNIFNNFADEADYPKILSVSVSL